MLVDGQDVRRAAKLLMAVLGRDAPTPPPGVRIEMGIEPGEGRRTPGRGGGAGQGEAVHPAPEEVRRRPLPAPVDGGFQPWTDAGGIGEGFVEADRARHPPTQRTEGADGGAVGVQLRMPRQLRVGAVGRIGLGGEMGQPLLALRLRQGLPEILAPDGADERPVGTGIEVRFPSRVRAEATEGLARYQAGLEVVEAAATDVREVHAIPLAV